MNSLRCLVLEKRGRDIWVLTDDGRVIKLKSKRQVTKGQILELKPYREYLGYFMWTLALFVLAFFLMAFLAGGIKIQLEAGEAAVELNVNYLGYVVEAKPLDEGGTQLLARTKTRRKHLDDAVGVLAREAGKLGLTDGVKEVALSGVSTAGLKEKWVLWFLQDEIKRCEKAGGSEPIKVRWYGFSKGSSL